MIAFEPLTHFTSVSSPKALLRYAPVRSQVPQTATENPIHATNSELFSRNLAPLAPLLACVSVATWARAAQKSHPKRTRRSNLTCRRAEGNQSHGSHPLVEVVKVNDVVGFGLVVPRGASSGDILIAEPPLYRRAEGESMADSVAAFQQMTPERRMKLLQMAASPGVPEKEVGFSGDDLHFVRVLRTNSVAIVGKTGGGAVYATSCRANHSCKPNAALCVQEDGVMHLKALRDLLPGEDVRVSYIGEGDLLRPTNHRQKQLANWGFVCHCERCTGPEDTRGFQCAACGAGIMKYEKSDVSGHRWGPCNCCNEVLPEETLLGTEQQWEEHALSLRPGHGELMPQIALAMYDGLISSLKEDSTAAPAPDAHWISAKLGRIAAEELIKKGRAQDAREAVGLLRLYVKSTLGNAATRVTAFSTYIEAAAALLDGNYQEALDLCQAALDEAALLPRNGDQLSEKIHELQALCQKQPELTPS